LANGFASFNACIRSHMGVSHSQYRVISAIILNYAARVRYCT